MRRRELDGEAFGVQVGFASPLVEASDRKPVSPMVGWLVEMTPTLLIEQEADGHSGQATTARLSPSGDQAGCVEDSLMATPIVGE